MENLIVGALALGFGLLTLVIRFVSPDSSLLGKLGPMKEMWGDAAGTALHWVAYTVLPLVAGVFLLSAGLAAQGG